MAKKRKRKVVPRLGPPTNLRPAGVHEDKRRKARDAADRAALAEDLGSAAHRGEDERR